MSYFEPVDVRLWGDKNFRELSKAPPNGQTLWTYLLTGPHNRGLPGLFNLGCGEISQRLGWQAGDVVTIAKTELIPRGMLQADWEAMVVLLPKVFRHKPPQSANNIIGWGKLWDGIAESELKTVWVFLLIQFVESLKDAALIEAARKTFQEVPAPAAPAEDEPEPEPETDLPQEAVDLAFKLKSLILGNDPKARVPTDGAKQMTAWIRDIEKLHRIDGREWGEIGEIIEWCQADTFWRGNILSGAALRKQFTRLVLARARGDGKRRSGNRKEMDELLGGDDGEAV